MMKNKVYGEAFNLGNKTISNAKEIELLIKATTELGVGVDD